MTDTVTIGLGQVSGYDVLCYFAEFGQRIDAGPYADLEQVIARWGEDGYALTAHDRTILGWLLRRQNGDPTASLTAFAAATAGLVDIDDEAPSGADVDAPGDG